ncbi:MAG: hypothetical protein F4Z01_03865 [Gammaproteobacteria bacterium]|nr:hypothetical protein [Gammaproteobacteria bacterium]MYF38528.1 hypothetical protein [Gammaproteobacteria bacterium]
MMNRSRKSSLWVYIVVAVLGALVFTFIFVPWLLWQLFSIEKTEERLTSEAYRNQWLAISKLSEHYDISVNVTAELVAKDLPALSDTVILEDVRSVIEDAEVSTALENWVVQGGTLIYRVPAINFDEDPRSVLQSQNFPANLLVFEKREQTGLFFPFANLRPTTKPPCDAPTLPIWFDDKDSATIAPRTNPYLDTSDSPYEEDIVTLAQMHFLRLNWGEGLVYFVTDLGLWSNLNADCSDNAYVFLRLVRGSVSLMPGLASELAVWIVKPTRPKTPHLLNLVWDNYHISIIGILLTFLVVIVARNIRSTPAIHAIPIPRRATIDYVTSASQFAWRKHDIKRFFKAFLWVTENPKGVFGPRTATGPAHKHEQADSKDPDTLNDSPTSEVDLIENVRKMQAKLRQNMQPSIRKS